MKLAEGPDKNPAGSYSFKGSYNSYIELPNRGNLDTEYSISILVWIRPVGNDGPIVNFNPNDYGVNLWVIGRNGLYVGFSDRADRKTRKHLFKKRVLKLNR